MRKLFLIVTISAISAGVPAMAKSSHPSHPSHPTTSHKCSPHAVAYVASGTLVSSALTKNSNGTYSGTLTVHVTRADRHAKGDKGTDVTYTLSSAKVRFGHRVSTTSPATGSRVRVRGKITALAKKCSTTGFSPTTTIHHVVIHAAKA